MLAVCFPVDPSLVPAISELRAFKQTRLLGRRDCGLFKFQTKLPLEKRTLFNFQIRAVRIDILPCVQSDQTEILTTPYHAHPLQQAVEGLL